VVQIDRIKTFYIYFTLSANGDKQNKMKKKFVYCLKRKIIQNTGVHKKWIWIKKTLLFIRLHKLPSYFFFIIIISSASVWWINYCDALVYIYHEVVNDTCKIFTSHSFWQPYAGGIKYAFYFTFLFLKLNLRRLNRINLLLIRFECFNIRIFNEWSKPHM